MWHVLAEGIVVIRVIVTVRLRNEMTVHAARTDLVHQSELCGLETRGKRVTPEGLKHH